MPYGAFVEFMPGKDGLLHISEIDWKRLETSKPELRKGDEIESETDRHRSGQRKFKLSRKEMVTKTGKLVNSKIWTA